MTETQTHAHGYVVEGPVQEQRWGSVGFRLADPLAPSACRRAARDLLKEFQLLWVPDLVDDVSNIVTELVANACAYGGDAHPAGSLTMWHPNTRLIIAVHDKNPYEPWDELDWAPRGYMDTSGRGLRIVRNLAARHVGTVSFASDGNKECPGKVTTVNMFLPDVIWPHSYYDPWRKRTIVGRS